MSLLGVDIAKLNHVASCIDSSTKAKIQLTSLLDLLFPEYNIFLKVKFIAKQSTLFLKNILQQRK